MNLRHIDPRSTDWMDAMLEHDDDQPLVNRRRTPTAGVPLADSHQAAAPPAPPQARAGAAPPTLEARGPGSR